MLLGRSCYVFPRAPRVVIGCAKNGIHTSNKLYASNMSLLLFSFFPALMLIILFYMQSLGAWYYNFYMSTTLDNKGEALCISMATLQRMFCFQAYVITPL